MMVEPPSLVILSVIRSIGSFGVVHGVWLTNRITADGGSWARAGEAIQRIARRLEARRGPRELRMPNVNRSRRAQ